MEKRKVEQAVTGTNEGVLRKEDLVPEQLVSEEYFISTRLLLYLRRCLRRLFPSHRSQR